MSKTPQECPPCSKCGGLTDAIGQCWRCQRWPQHCICEKTLRILKFEVSFGLLDAANGVTVETARLNTRQTLMAAACLMTPPKRSTMSDEEYTRLLNTYAIQWYEVSKGEVE